jgi:hypothetical protein
MKLQINTETKTIKIEDKVNLTELFDLLNKMFPNQEWREFSLETNNTIIDWKQPIVINYPPYPNYQIYPWITIPISAPNTDPTYPIFPQQPWIGDPLPGQHPHNICGDNIGINEMDNYNCKVNSQDNTISKINSNNVPLKNKNTDTAKGFLKGSTISNSVSLVSGVYNVEIVN